MWRDNPARAEEYRSVSRSTSRWNEYRSQSGGSRTTLAEFEGRLRALEERLQLEPGTLTR